jgi:hypothetical protein
VCGKEKEEIVISSAKSRREKTPEIGVAGKDDRQIKSSQIIKLIIAESQGMIVYNLDYSNFGTL